MHRSPSSSSSSDHRFAEERQRVLDATDIVRLIGDHIALKKKGREYVGLCPFHDDHSPSMCVVPHKQMYHCFSCEAGGNAFGFVMNYHRMPFREALEYLAERAGITLAPRQLFRAADGAGASPSDSPKSALLAASATAQSFFRAVLQHPEHGQAARDLISRRAISPDIAEQFQLGASPDKWDGLLLTIQHKGLDLAPFRQAGLLKQREGSSGFYDAFRNRLMFPIHDQLGRVVAFGARRINDDDDPKYLNSSESAIFDKSSTLYALHHATPAIRKSRLAIVTEGYMDAIACHQAGVTNAVATLGTALTPGNARILKRLCDTVVLLFDGDDAGMRAAERAVEVFFAEPIDVRVCMLSRVTDAKDPDELLKREGGVELLNKAIAASSDPLELLFQRIESAVKGQGLSAQTRVVEEFAARLVDLGLSRLEPVRYQLVIRRLAQIAGVDWQTIADTLAQRRARQRPAAIARADSSVEASPSGTPPAATRAPAALTPAEHLLGCIMCDPALTLSLAEDQWDLIEPDAFQDPTTRAVAQAMMDVVVEEQSPALSCVLAVLLDPEAQRIATRLASTVDRLTQGDASVLRAHWRDRLRDAQFVAHRAAPAAPPPSSTQSSTVSLAASLDRIKSLRATHGHNPRAVPRPVP